MEHNLIVVALSSIAIFPGENYSREAEAEGLVDGKIRQDLYDLSTVDQRDLVASMHQYGWIPERSSILLTTCVNDVKTGGYGDLLPDVIDVDFMFADAEGTSRKVTHKVTQGEVHAEYEQTFATSKAKAKFEPVAGFQRLFAILIDNICRVREGMPRIAEITAVVKEFASKADRIGENIRENQGQSVGVRTMSNSSLVLSAERLWRVGKTAEKDLAAIIPPNKRGMIQKVHSLRALDMVFCEGAYGARLKRGEWPHFGSCNKEDLRKLRKELIDSGIPTGDTLETAKLTVAAYLDNPKGDDGPKAVRASKADIEGLSKSAMCQVIRDVAQADLNGTTAAVISRYNNWAMSGAINAAVARVDADKKAGLIPKIQDGEKLVVSITDLVYSVEKLG